MFLRRLHLQNHKIVFTKNQTQRYSNKSVTAKHGVIQVLRNTTGEVCGLAQISGRKVHAPLILAGKSELAEVY